MRLADSIVTRHQRIKVREKDMMSGDFTNAMPVYLARATVLDVTEVYQLSDGNPEELRYGHPVVPPWHLSFLEMSAKPGLDYGILFVRDSDGLDDDDEKSSKRLGFEIISASIIRRDPEGVHALGIVRFTVATDTGKLLSEDLHTLVNRDALYDKDELELVYTVGLQSFTFAHCKNVLVESRLTPPKLVAKFTRRHGQPPVKYKILNIRPVVRQIREDNFDVTSSEIDRAMHVCRGHFRTYSEQRKLFGRISGTFWVDEHTRGSEASGTVVKDYKMSEESCVG